MKWICEQIADWCQRNGNVSDEEYSTILYGLQVIVNSSVKIVGVLMLGAYLGVLKDTIISMIVFCSMRYWTGGWHSNTHIGCFSSMLLPCLGPSFFKGVETEWMVSLWVCMIAYSLYQILRYAPRNSKINPILDSRILRKKRVGSIVESIILAVIVCLWQDTEICWLVIIPLFVDGVMLSNIVSGSKKCHISGTS